MKNEVFPLYTHQMLLSVDPSVSPLPDQTHRPHVTPPGPPSGDSPFQPTEGLLVPVVAVVTAFSLSASVGLVVVLGWVAESGWRGGGGDMGLAGRVEQRRVTVIEHANPMMLDGNSGGVVVCGSIFDLRTSVIHACDMQLQQTNRFFVCIRSDELF